MSKLTLGYVAEHFFGIGIESIITGKLQEEIELTIYAEMQDINDLTKAVSKEMHEQYDTPLDTETDVRMRIRGINGKRWIQTIKVPHKDKPGNWEVEHDISEDAFKLLRAATPKEGYVKERYFFPVVGTDLVYEIDVYRNNGGVQHAWVKIDLEFKDTTQEIPPLPFATKARIYSDDPATTQAEKDWIDRLWQEEWQSTKLTT